MPEESGAAEPIGPLNRGMLEFQGPIELGTTYFLGTKLNGVQGSYRLGRNVFEISDLCGTIEDGRFAAGLEC